MNFKAQLRKIFSAVLLTTIFLTSTAFGFVSPHALAANDRETNSISNVKGDSSGINRSYHQLQAATQEHREDYENGRKNDQKEFLNGQGNSPKKAVKNAGKNTRNAFERSADNIKKTLDPNK